MSVYVICGGNTDTRSCFYQEEATSDQGPESKEADSASRHWLEYQAGQQILLQTPSVLVGFRVEVYRTEGATQWYTAVIKSYNENTRVSQLITAEKGHARSNLLHAITSK